MFPKLTRNAFWLFVAIVAFYLLWLPYVPRLVKHNPKKTALMQLRETQAKRAKLRLRSTQIWKPLGTISPNLIHAVIISEDDTFYRHHGIDGAQIVEAMRRNWQEKRYAYGGSTITQQLARTLYLSPQKSLLRKTKEALIALWMEQALPKKRILELYMNTAEWGKGIYGAEAASQHYFNKPASDLTPDEAISLASILPSPRRWSPLSEKAYMARRRTQLVHRMKIAGYLPSEYPIPLENPFEVEMAPSLPVEISTAPLRSSDIPFPVP